MVVGALVGAGVGSALGNVLAGQLAGDGGKDEYRRILQLANLLQTPTFDRRQVVPPEYRVIAEYFPELYEQQVAQDVSVPGERPETRDSQMAALRSLQQVQEEGIPLADQIQAQQLQGLMAGEASRNQEAILQNLAERGRLSGGDEIAARMMGNQQQANLARDFGQDLTQESLARKLAAAYGVGQMAGGIREQDFAHEAERSNVMNRFNEWVSAQMTQQMAANAAAQERAQFANVGRQQSVADETERARYLGELENLNRLNDLSQQAFQNDLSKFGAQSGALSQYGMVKDTEAASRAQAIRGIAGGAGQALGGLAGLGGGGTGAAPVRPPGYFGYDQGTTRGYYGYDRR